MSWKPYFSTNVVSKYIRINSGYSYLINNEDRHGDWRSDSTTCGQRNATWWQAATRRFGDLTRRHREQRPWRRQYSQRIRSTTLWYGVTTRTRSATVESRRMSATLTTNIGLPSDSSDVEVQERGRQLDSTRPTTTRYVQIILFESVFGENV